MKPPVDLRRELPARFVHSIFREEGAFLADGIWYRNAFGDASYACSQGSGDEPVCLLFSCPGCGQINSCPFQPWQEGQAKWTWDRNRDAPTLWPSILHDTAKGGCGWHGYLTAGRFQLDR